MDVIMNIYGRQNSHSSKRERRNNKAAKSSKSGKGGKEEEISNDKET